MPWLTEELASTFHIHSVDPLSLEDNAAILRAQHPKLDVGQLQAIMAVVRTCVSWCRLCWSACTGVPL